MYPRQVSGGFDNEKTIFSTNNSGFDWSTTIRFGAIQIWNGNYREQTPLTLVENRWYHLVSSFDPSNSRINIYLNNQPVSLNTIGFDSSTDFIRLGRDDHTTGRSFDGLLDDVRVWGRPLSSAEVSKLWGNGMGDFGQCSFRNPKPVLGR